MIRHQETVEYGGVKVGVRIRVEREHWYEWFFLDCYHEYIKEIKKMRSVGFFYVNLGEHNPTTLNVRLYLFPLVPFVLAGRKLRDWWWGLARVVCKLGFLKYREGELLPRFWPRRISLRRTGARCESCRKWFVSPDLQDRLCRDCFNA